MGERAGAVYKNHMHLLLTKPLNLLLTKPLNLLLTKPLTNYKNHMHMQPPQMKRHLQGASTDMDFAVKLEAMLQGGGQEEEEEEAADSN